MERLLVFADDASEGADIAWAWVCAQEWSGWRAEVLTVTPADDASEAGGSTTWTPDRPRTAPPAAGLASISHVLAHGDPRTVLADVSADLLVIGPRGAGLRKKLHLGSVAESLLTCPNTPTVIAKGPRPVRHITVAADGSAHSSAALAVLATLPWARQAHIDIVGVETGDGSASDGVRAAEQAAGDAFIDVNATILRPQEWDLTVNVRSDLARFVEEHPCDLVAMGTQGLRGLRRLRVGSTADYLSRHVDCPVLLVRDRKATD
jgi:nucleotide-binding universal stress UspA family protein